MRTIGTARLAGAVLTVALCGAGALVAADEKIALDAVPKPVLDAVKARFKDAELKKAEKEVEHGKVLYEVGIKTKDGQKIDVSATADGTLVSIEKTIDAKDLPAAVSKAIDVKYPKATYKRAEEITKVEGGTEKLAAYEVLIITTEKKRVEVLVAPDGKILPPEDED